MELFRDDNTEGYSQQQLDELNREWEAIVESKQLEEGTDDYSLQAKGFCDEVARR